MKDSNVLLKRQQLSKLNESAKKYLAVDLAALAKAGYPENLKSFQELNKDAELFAALKNRYDLLREEKESMENAPASPGKMIASAIFGIDKASTGGFLVSSFNGLLHFLSVSVNALLVTISGTVGLGLMGLMTLWKLALTYSNKLVGQRNTRLAVGLAVVGMIPVALGILFAAFAAPAFALPLIFCGFMGLAAYEEHTSYKDNLAAAEQLEAEIKSAESLLADKVALVLKTDEDAVKIQQEIKQHHHEMRAIVTGETQLAAGETKSQLIQQKREAINNLELQLPKVLYRHEEIRTSVEKINTDKRRAAVLRTQAEYAKEKRNACIFGLCGAGLLGLSALFPLIAPIGIMMVIIAGCEYKNAHDQEIAKLEAIQAGTEADPLVQELDHLHSVAQKCSREAVPANAKPIEKSVSQSAKVADTNDRSSLRKFSILNSGRKLDTADISPSPLAFS